MLILNDGYFLNLILVFLLSNIILYMLALTDDEC